MAQQAKYVGGELAESGDLVEAAHNISLGDPDFGRGEVMRGDRGVVVSVNANGRIILEGSDVRWSPDGFKLVARGIHWLDFSAMALQMIAWAMQRERCVESQAKPGYKFQRETVTASLANFKGATAHFHDMRPEAGEREVFKPLEPADVAKLIGCQVRESDDVPFGKPSVWTIEGIRRRPGSEAQSEINVQLERESGGTCSIDLRTLMQYARVGSGDYLRKVDMEPVVFPSVREILSQLPVCPEEGCRRRALGVKPNERLEDPTQFNCPSHGGPMIRWEEPGSASE